MPARRQDPPRADPTRSSAAEWLESVKEAERRGELLEAVDLAERGLEQHPGDLALRHRAVLALARSGSTREAARRFDSYGLSEVAEEDVAALGARIAKDDALAAWPVDPRRAAEAAQAYRSVFARTGGYYPAINAATLSLISGQTDRSRDLAREVLGLVGDEDEHEYYAAATEAEADLILGDEKSARRAIERAAETHGGDHLALATTRRQLRIVCDLTGTDPGILEPLSGPAVVHFCGHRISESNDGRFAAPDENRVAGEIAAAVDRHPAAYAYGSLAAGGDILWAEALLARGCDLHIVLPFAEEEFVRSSVAPSGPAWVQRFRRCLASARDVKYATDDAFVDDDVLYRYGTELAMGLALLRARYLDADVRQLALWDGAPALGEAGTAIDVEKWRSLGREVSIVAPPSHRDEPGVDAHQAEPADGPRRVVRAMLFADVRGFSKLTDEELPRFPARVLGAFADTLARHADAIEHQNTWGDALYVVLEDAEAAAACAVDLQAAMDSVDLEAEGLPTHLALRLGGHVGPVFPVDDPVLKTPAFMGSHVSRTARIEPVTPAGAVYVTEPFAAALALAGRDEFACDYVGHMPAAKGFGRMRMYRLWRRKNGEPIGARGG